MNNNIFVGENVRVYAGKWSVKSSRGFTEAEINSVERTEIVPSNYGTSCCFFMKGGSRVYYPMSTNSSKGIGESIDLSTARILTLSKSGESDITRIED